MRHAQHNRMVNQKTSRPISLEMRSSLQRLVCEVGQRCLAREARLGDIALLNAIAGMTVAESTYDKLQLFLNNWQANPEKRTMFECATCKLKFATFREYAGHMMARHA